MLAPTIRRRTLSLMRGVTQLRFASVAATRSEQQPRRTELEVGKAVMKRIELVPRRLHEHLFGATATGRGGYPEDELPTEKDKSLERMQLPKLTVQGDLMGHFHNLAAEQFQGYDALLDMALDITSPPGRPLKWVMQVGWTAYDPVTGEPMQVEFPDEDLLFFDVEICVLDGQLPTLAIAMSPTRWYSWCSDRLVNLSDVPSLPRVHHLIRLESPNSAERRKKIVVGHNVAFDRSRVMEQYYREVGSVFTHQCAEAFLVNANYIHIQKTPARFWDTMSMAIAVCGMADHQRIMYEQSDSSRIASPGRNDWITDWRMRVSKNSLGGRSPIEHHAVGGFSLELKKDLRDFFVREEMHTIRDKFQALTDYCADDVQAAFEVNKALYPIFKSRFTSPVTYCGMLEMSCAYLPITSNWREFSVRCDESAEAKQYAARDIVKSAIQLKLDLLNDLQPASGEESPAKSYTRDPWMWCADWTPNAKTKEPAWYANLFKTRQDMLVDVEELTTGNVKLQGRDLPRIFGLCYGPYPLFFKLDYGWGFLVPADRTSYSKWPDVEMVCLKRGETVPFPNRAIYELIQQNRRDCVPEVILRSQKVSSIGIFDFYRLPHPDGKETNVGSPFVKDYRENYNEGVLWATRFWPVLASMLQSSGETRLWTNYRKRFNEQLAVWLDEEGKVGAIAPSIIPAGTVTRRAVHKLWLVSFNPKEGMIGSDLKSMVQCADGWNLVGADVDSQEQWLAALFGDSITAERRAGSTAFSNMLLAGSKSDQSDLHSVVAKAVGISRENAKILNYARLYGAGEAHTYEFLKKSGTSEGVAKKQSEKLFTTTKGSVTTYRELHSGLVADFKEFLRTECPENYRDQHIYADNRYFIPVYRQVKGEQSALYERHVAAKEEDMPNHDSLRSSIYKDYPKEYLLYKGGFESYTFNFLELRSQEKEPKTPILGCRLSQALEPLPAHVADAPAFMRKYKRSVINWFVQSSAVDFLHLLLVSMNWLIEKYKIEARFVISIHDEVRYMVKSEDKYRCALALVLSNMYVRAAISHQLGIDELPKSIAFFSQVDLDTVLRKEVTHTCRTPTGQTVPPGEALDVHQIIEKTGGSLCKSGADGEEQRVVNPVDSH